MIGCISIKLNWKKEKKINIGIADESLFISLGICELKVFGEFS